MSSVTKYESLAQDEKSIPLTGKPIEQKQETSTASWIGTGAAVAVGVTVGTVIFPLGGQVVGGYLGYWLTTKKK